MIKLHTTSYESGAVVREEAARVYLNGHDYATWVLHWCDGGTVSVPGAGWCVSEITTGRSVLRGTRPTQDEAIAAAQKTLDDLRMTAARFASVLALCEVINPPEPEAPRLVLTKLHALTK